MHTFNRSIWSRALTVALVMALLTSNVALAAKPLVIKTPTSGEVVSGVYLVTGAGGGAAVQVSIDGSVWQAATGTKSWSYSWNTTTYADGPHTVYARYVDGTSTTSVNVTVTNNSGPRQPVVGEVLVNEFVAANGTLQTTEWVELYNTTTETLDIGNMWIDDIIAGGGRTPANSRWNNH